jgi:hypothetical protein
MTGLYQESDICVHKPYFHSHVLPIRKYGTTVSPVLLNEGEDVILDRCEQKALLITVFHLAYPASTVKPCGMISQFEQYFFHLKCGWESFDEDCGTNSVQRHSNIRLGEHEDVIPKACLQIMLHLRQIEIRPKAGLHKHLRVVEEI